MSDATSRLLLIASYISGYLAAAARPGALPITPGEAARLAAELRAAREAVQREAEAS
jgi:hypothetical protein